MTNEWCPQHGYPLPCDKCGLSQSVANKEQDVEKIVGIIKKDRMYRTCNGCWADKCDPKSKYCRLRYRRKLVRIAQGIELFTVPDETCPKPKTWKEYSNTPEREGEGRR